MNGSNSVPKRPLAPPPPEETVSIDKLDRMPYLTILTYPRPDLRVAKARIKQLDALGVREVTFEGQKPKIGRLGLLGIGTVGLVVKATVDDGKKEGGSEPRYALKIRRTDANRESMLEEFRLTQIANRLRVGATVYRKTRDFILMQLVSGPELEDYVKDASGRGSARKVRDVTHSLLNQCRKLDLIGLDHGQLSNLRKHVIMEGETPYIIDFESASQNRATKNVTTAAQYLFLGSSLSPRVRRMLSIKRSDDVLDALKTYKKEMSDESYVRLLATFGVII
jgi:putative serine/threonine protein kinase